MDKKKTNKKKLSTLIKQQVPEFVLTDHPKFTEFLTSYFLFMESAELNLDTVTDIDQILLENGVVKIPSDLPQLHLSIKSKMV